MVESMKSRLDGLGFSAYAAVFGGKTPVHTLNSKLAFDYSDMTISDVIHYKFAKLPNIIGAREAIARKGLA
jgi:hypothetical protein